MHKQSLTLVLLQKKKTSLQKIAPNIENDIINDFCVTHRHNFINRKLYLAPALEY